MRTLFLFLFLWSFNLSAQTYVNRIGIGMELTSTPAVNGLFQFEQQSDWVKVQLTYITDKRINLKMGFRPIKKEDFQVWIFMPYLNMNLDPIGYNSPLSIEFQYKRWRAVFDSGLKDVNVQLRFVHPIYVNELLMEEK